MAVFGSRRLKTYFGASDALEESLMLLTDHVEGVGQQENDADDYGGE